MHVKHIVIQGAHAPVSKTIFYVVQIFFKSCMSMTAYYVQILNFVQNFATCGKKNEEKATQDIFFLFVVLSFFMQRTNCYIFSRKFVGAYSILIFTRGICFRIFFLASQTDLLSFFCLIINICELKKSPHMLQQHQMQADPG